MKHVIVIETVDPQPGLATWCMFLGKVMQELTEEWNQSE